MDTSFDLEIAMRMTEEQYEALMSRRPMTGALIPPPPPRVSPKRPKYGNVRVTDCDGLTHDSRREYRRWQELQLREVAGEISGLQRQVVFDLVVGDQLVCRYVADAVYVDCATGEKIVEDTKSPPTRKKRDYRIKAKLMKAVHGIEIREVL